MERALVVGRHFAGIEPADSLDDPGSRRAILPLCVQHGLQDETEGTGGGKRGGRHEVERHGQELLRLGVGGSERPERSDGGRDSWNVLGWQASPPRCNQRAP